MTLPNDQPLTYRVIELGAPRHGVQSNERVTDFDSLETHHPGSNVNIRMRDGLVVDGEPRRTHAFIGAQFEEIETRQPRRDFGLDPDQVLLKKDFILEHPDHPRAREVDVPAPVSGYVGRVSEREGLVDILDRQGGDVIARIRHMDPIVVGVGDEVTYGQSLGTQNRMGLPQSAGKHVHMEMDTRYYQQYENYLDDLINGRLPVQAEYRQGVQPLPIVDDGTFRLGESDSRIGDLQRVMANEGYRATYGRALDQDSVYRPSMQGALLDFQRAHNIPQTGDIDPATLRFASSLEAQLGPPPVDHALPGHRGLPGHMRPPGPMAPGRPDHPEHRSGLPDALPAPINQRAPGLQAGLQPGPFSDPLLNQAYAAALRDDDAGLGRVAQEFSLSREGQQMAQLGRELHAQQQLQEQQMAQSQSRGRSM